MKRGDVKIRFLNLEKCESYFLIVKKMTEMRSKKEVITILKNIQFKKTALKVDIPMDINVYS